jgi:hypothetical protein
MLFLRVLRVATAAGECGGDAEHGHEAEGSR